MSIDEIVGEGSECHMYVDDGRVWTLGAVRTVTGDNDDEGVTSGNSSSGGSDSGGVRDGEGGDKVLVIQWGHAQRVGSMVRDRSSCT